ncbi:MAG: hypothetical protein ACI4LZ_02170 [Anaerovoracaceae bacterium]
MKMASNKFEIIHDIINTPGNVLPEELCKTADVSRSGYFNPGINEDKRICKTRKTLK